MKRPGTWLHVTWSIYSSATQQEQAFGRPAGLMSSSVFAQMRTATGSPNKLIGKQSTLGVRLRSLSTAETLKPGIGEKWRMRCVAIPSSRR